MDFRDVLGLFELWERRPPANEATAILARALTSWNPERDQQEHDRATRAANNKIASISTPGAGPVVTHDNLPPNIQQWLADQRKAAAITDAGDERSPQPPNGARPRHQFRPTLPV